MLEIKINPFLRAEIWDDAEFYAENGRVLVSKPGRGEWTGVNAGAGDLLVGFDGENTISVTAMGMQDSSWNVVAVLAQVDNPLIVLTAQGNYKDDKDPSFEGMDKAIIKLVTRLANRAS